MPADELLLIEFVAFLAKSLKYPSTKHTVFSSVKPEYFTPMTHSPTQKFASLVFDFELNH